MGNYTKMLAYLGFNFIFSFVDCSRTLPRKNYGTLVLYFYFLFIKCYVLGLISSKKKVKNIWGICYARKFAAVASENTFFFSFATAWLVSYTHVYRHDSSHDSVMKIISQTFHTEQINSLSQDVNALGSAEFYAQEVSKYLVCIMSEKCL